MKKRILLAILLILVASVLLFAWRHFGKRDNRSLLTLSGNMEVTETNVGFKLPGRVIELSVEEGQAVREGDILARIDNAELTSIVAQNRAALKEAEIRLSELKAGSRHQEIEQARANVRTQEADLAKVRRDYERAEILYGNGAISFAQFDATKSAYEARQAQHRSAMESLSLVKEGPRREDIEGAQSRVQQARAALAAAEERLKETVIYAPISGVVLRKNIELGETVAQGIPVYRIGDMANPWIKVYVKENRLGLVKLGQKATVKTDTYPGKTYEGWVSYIASDAEFTPKNVQTPEERVKLVFGVKVRVRNVRDELKPGMPADVLIETGTSEKQ